MNLYEIVTTGVGCSYERAYAWAVSRERALELFTAQHPDARILITNLVFKGNRPEFVSGLDCEGFGAIT